MFVLVLDLLEEVPSRRGVGDVVASRLAFVATAAKLTDHTSRSTAHVPDQGAGVTLLGEGFGQVEPAL